MSEKQQQDTGVAASAPATALIPKQTGNTLPPAYYQSPDNQQQQQQAGPVAVLPPSPSNVNDPNAINTAPPVVQQYPGTDPKSAEGMNSAPVQQLVPLVTPLEQLSGETPQYIDCPFCHQRALTKVRREGTPLQFLTGAICCIICVCLACVPCIAGWFEDTLYSCSACNKLVAKRNDDGAIQVYGPQILVPSQNPPAPAQKEIVR